MKTLPDNSFDLAIVDPPYGNCGKETEYNLRFHGGNRWKRYLEKKTVGWDIAPKQEYFDELFRVSKNQIIWGGNYFSLPPCRCFLIWQKLTISEKFSMAMCEYAWTSFNENAKYFACAPQGTPSNPRIHPTQKPIKLYDWIISHYAKACDKILDTHVGSGSSRIACYKAGLDFVGCEIDKDYFEAQEKRFNDFVEKDKASVSLFCDVSEPA